ncbi:MAG TPA: hypothetical protein VLY23_06585 [Candidatus Acidoferrum sp.]|nr:hypothetical protein [Candidatus Acidoferrum sp.]
MKAARPGIVPEFWQGEYKANEVGNPEKGVLLRLEKASSLCFQQDSDDSNPRLLRLEI